MKSICPSILAILLCATGSFAANQPPVLQPIGNKTVEAGSPLSFTVRGSNSDADLLSFGTGKDVPIIFWVSQPVKPDETILATCGGTDSSSTAQLARLADGDPGSPLAAKPLPTSWTNITPHTASNRSVFATVPANWARGIYAMRLKTGAVTGPVRLVNAPDPWFVQGDMGDTATPGGFFIVAGNCLEIPNYKGPRIALVRNGAVVKTIGSPVRMTTSEGYALRFAVPSDTPEGDYTLYVHNGCGGPSGWVRYSSFSHEPIETVTVRAFQPWPATVFSVAAPSGSGNDAKITAALDLAKANGGGVVLIPEGTYLLTQPVLIPARVILRGAGRAKTFLKWVNNPSVSNPDLPGLVMNLNYTKDEPFGLEDMSLEITNNDYWGPVVYRGFTRVPSVFQRLDIKAPLLDTSVEKNMPFGIHLRRTSNLRIHDVSVVSSKGIFGRDDVTHIRVTDSTVTWNNFAFKFSGKNHNLIINNNVVLVSGPTRTHTSLGLTPFHDPKGPYNRDFLWANNRIAAAEGFEDHFGGYTADGSDGIYLGKVSGCDGNTMTLAGSTSTVDVGGKPVDYTWTGAVAVILDGRGSGQWRYLIGTTPGVSTVTLDRPWDILPDANSIVTLIHMMGRYLMIDNDYVNDGQHDDYYISNDSIKAGNRFGTVVKTFTATTWTGRHYLGTFPGLHVQFLDNSFVRDAPSLIKTLVDNTPESSYQGVVLSGHVYRNNVDVSPGVGPTTIQFRTNEGRASDALFEGNTIDLLSFRQADENMDVQHILVRGNRIPGSSTPTTLNPVAPIPGVTVIP